MESVSSGVDVMKEQKIGDEKTSDTQTYCATLHWESEIQPWQRSGRIHACRWCRRGALLLLLPTSLSVSMIIVLCDGLELPSTSSSSTCADGLVTNRSS